jgi:hypothetical protein
MELLDLTRYQRPYASLWDIHRRAIDRRIIAQGKVIDRAAGERRTTVGEG